MDTEPEPTLVGRRLLVGGAVGLLVGCASGGGSAETSDGGEGTGASEARGTQGLEPNGASGPDLRPEPGQPPPLSPAMFEVLPTCALTPSAPAGPFPSPELLDRSDITEGRPGHALRLGLRVVDADCNPVPGAVVDIWHADSTGDYSAFTDNGSGKDEGEGTTFLRGAQMADDNGILEFQTVYPGWYEGRAVHIHASVHLDGGTTLTTQLYFDEAYTDAISAEAPYAEFGPPDTPWSQDGLIGDPSTDGTGIALSPGPTVNGSGSLGLAQLGVSA